jgi:hypothetical protein
MLFMALLSRAATLAELPETPYGAYLVGENLLAVGSDQKLWLKHLQNDPVWRQIEQPSFGADYATNWFSCDRARCVVSVRQNAVTRLFLYQPSDGKAVPLNVEAAEVVAWIDGAFFMFRHRKGTAMSAPIPSRMQRTGRSAKFAPVN